MLSAINQLNKQENYDKYKTGGEITAKVLDIIVNAAKVTTTIKTLCELGDVLLTKELNKVYTKAKLSFGKGIAMPTCISINNLVGWNGPDNAHIGNMYNKYPEQVIKEGDLVKIELGIHIDGFPSFICHTLVIENNNEASELNNKKQKLMKAVSEASKEIIKIMKPGRKNTDIVKIMEKYANKYECNLLYTDDIEKAVPGTVSYQISQNNMNGKNDDFIIDGLTKVVNEDIHSLIIHRMHIDHEYGMVESEFEENEVYAIDIAMSTGSGRIAYGDYKPYLFKKNNKTYTKLKLKSSRNIITRFNDKHFPITFKNIQDCANNKKMSTPAFVKAGLSECTKKNLIVPYDVYYEKSGEYIARSLFTVIVRKKPKLIAGRSLDDEIIKLK